MIDDKDFSIDDASLIMDGYLANSNQFSSESSKNKIAKETFMENLYKKQAVDKITQANIVKEMNDYDKKEKEMILTTKQSKKYQIAQTKIDDLLLLVEKEFENDLGNEQKKEKFKEKINDKVDSLISSNAFDRLILKSKSLQKPQDNYIKIDIYSDNLITYFEYIITESAEVKNNFNVSLIMKLLSNELSKLEEDNLNPENKYKKKYFIKLIDYLSHLPIKDAQNFKKVYDIHKEAKIDI